MRNRIGSGIIEAMTTKLSSDLVWRGLIKDKTFTADSWLDEPRRFYLGIDASAPSLTVGNLAIIMLARRLSDGGWKAVLVMGGGTSLVGDPGGKSQERQLKSRDEIKANIAGVREQVKNLFSGENFEMVDNYDWLADLKYLDFLRDVGKHFSMTELMQREFVTERMGEGGAGISYAEFSYSLVQGYDYWHLYKHLQTELQIGGSDQWGNILSGVALVRKKENAEVHAMSMPLVVNKATGVKFGKSEGGAIWLDPAQTSPTQFYQFWMNADDSEVEDHLKIFTLLSRDEIDKIMAEHMADTAKRTAQKILAEEVTKLVHGAAADSATGVTKYLTGEALISEASAAELAKIREEVPSVKATVSGSLVQSLVEAGLADSNSDARRLLASGAVYINGKTAVKDSFTAADFSNGRLLLRRGKAFKDSALVEAADE